MMKLRNLLTQRKGSIVPKWFDVVVATYPADTAAFLTRQSDPFANPVGRTTLKGLEALFDEIVSSMNAETITDFLDPIIRIRAVQDFTPSRAVGFVLELKRLITDALQKDLDDPELAVALITLHRNIDTVCLMAFDIFVRCREQLHNLRINETRNTMFSALERAGLVTTPDMPPRTSGVPDA